MSSPASRAASNSANVCGEEGLSGELEMGEDVLDDGGVSKRGKKGNLGLGQMGLLKAPRRGNGCQGSATADDEERALKATWNGGI
jgi:hypothetical protein